MREETEQLKEFISSRFESHIKGSLNNLCQEVESKKSASDWLEDKLSQLRDEHPNEYIITLFLKRELEDYKDFSEFFKNNLEKVKRRLNQWTKLLQNRHL